MTIETKYNIGDEVWVKGVAYPICVTIDVIHISSNNITYDVKSGVYVMECAEKHIFPTKEELLKIL